MQGQPRHAAPNHALLRQDQQSRASLAVQRHARPRRAQLGPTVPSITGPRTASLAVTCWTLPTLPHLAAQGLAAPASPCPARPSRAATSNALLGAAAPRRPRHTAPRLARTGNDLPCVDEPSLASHASRRYAKPGQDRLNPASLASTGRASPLPRKAIQSQPRRARLGRAEPDTVLLSTAEPCLALPASTGCASP